MSRLIPQYNMPAVDVGGALAGVLQTSKDRSSGLGTIAETLQQHTEANEKLRAKAVEEQRLADMLALEQLQADRLNQYNLSNLDLRGQELEHIKKNAEWINQYKQNMIEIDKQRLNQDQKQFEAMQSERQAKQAVSNFTNKAIADIFSQSTIEEQRKKYAYYSQMPDFNPDARTIFTLNESWQPKPQEYKSAFMHKVNTDGSVILVETRSPEEEKRFLEMGYGHGKFSGGNGGSDSKSKIAEKEMAAYNKLYEKVNDFGWSDKYEAWANLKMIQGMGIPSVLAEKALIEAKDKEFWKDKRFDLNTIDNVFGDFTTKDGETVRLGTYIQKAKDRGAVVTYDQATGTLQMVKPAIQVPSNTGTLKEITNSPQDSLRSRGREWMGPSLGEISNEDIIDPFIFGGM